MKNLSCTLIKVTSHSAPQHSNLHIHTGAMMRDLTVEQHLNGADQCSTNHKGSIKQVSHHHYKGKTMPYHQYAYLCSCLVSDSIPYYSHNSTSHMSAHHSTRSCSPLKTVLGKIQRQISGLLYHI